MDYVLFDESQFLGKLLWKFKNESLIVFKIPKVRNKINITFTHIWHVDI